MTTALAEEKKVFDSVIIGGRKLEKGMIVPLNNQRARLHGQGLMARKHGHDATFEIISFEPAPKLAKSLTNHEHLANVKVVTGRFPKGTPVQVSTFFITPDA